MEYLQRPGNSEVAFQDIDHHIDKQIPSSFSRFNFGYKWPGADDVFTIQQNFIYFKTQYKTIPPITPPSQHKFSLKKAFKKSSCSYHMVFTNDF